MKATNKELHSSLWLWLPIIWLMTQISGEFILSADTILYLHKEGSIHEIIQFLLLSASFVLALITLCKINYKVRPWLTAWIILAAIACLYVALEEISYGQSFFQWDTPDTWKELNNQNETNFHNTSRLLNHIPRYLLMAGIAIGGLILPIFYLFKIPILPKKISIIYPPSTLSITAICLLLIAVSNKAYKEIYDEKLFQRASEIEEIFMYFFVFLYILILKKRATA